MSLHIEERGRGDALLFLPGFTESADEFERLVATLADRYHVIAIDLPGSGRSGPQPRAYTADLYEDDAWLAAFAELVDHPTDRLRPWRDALVARYGADVARATLQSWTTALRTLLARGGDISLGSADRIVCPVLL